MEEFFFLKFYFQLDLTFKGLKILNNLTTKKVYVVLLENLIKNKSKVMKEFSKYIKLILNKFTKLYIFWYAMVGGSNK